MQPKKHTERALDLLQKVSLTLMALLIMITFAAANLQAMLWQSSQWLVSTVLPAVVVELTNEERTDNAVQPLKRNATLDAAAKMKAEHMAKNEYFAHFAPDGTSPWYWFRQAGYNYAHAGENLAIHFTDSAEVVEAWMNSPTHRENIVNGKYTEIGVGTAKGRFDGHNTVYVVQLFGTPAVRPAPAPAPVAAATNPTPTTPPAPVVPENEAVLAAETREESVLETAPQTVVSSTTPATSSDEGIPTTTLASAPVAPLPPATPTERLITEETVLLQSSMIATSSGLEAASATESVVTEAAPLAGIATRPNTVLQVMYIMLGTIVVSLLLASIAFEVRRRHVTQVIYGVGLLIIMTGLWFFHSYITSGAVIM